MRLIDADELIENLEDDYNYFISQGRKEIADVVYYLLIPTVKCQSTVEQKHGHWERRNMDIVEHPLHCTNCGWSNHHIDRYVESFKICPECGAKMDERCEE